MAAAEWAEVVQAREAEAKGSGAEGLAVRAMVEAGSGVAAKGSKAEGLAVRAMAAAGSGVVAKGSEVADSAVRAMAAAGSGVRGMGELEAGLEAAGWAARAVTVGPQAARALPKAEDRSAARAVEGLVLMTGTGVGAVAAATMGKTVALLASRASELASAPAPCSSRGCGAALHTQHTASGTDLEDVMSCILELRSCGQLLTSLRCCTHSCATVTCFARLRVSNLVLTDQEDAPQAVRAVLEA